MSITKWETRCSELAGDEDKSTIKKEHNEWFPLDNKGISPYIFENIYIDVLKLLRNLKRKLSRNPYMSFIIGYNFTVCMSLHLWSWSTVVSVITFLLYTEPHQMQKFLKLFIYSPCLMFSITKWQCCNPATCYHSLQSPDLICISHWILVHVCH